MRKRIVTLVIAVTLILGMSTIGQAFAVSASMSGGGTYEVGDTVTVTLTYSGGQFGAVQGTFSYNSNVLTLQGNPSGGTYNAANGIIIMDAAGASSLSMTFTFKATAVGPANISVSNVTGGTIDKVEFNNGASTVVTVVEPATSTPSTPSGSQGSGGSSSSGSSGSSSSGGSGTTHSSPSGTNGRGDFTEEEAVEQEEPDPSEKPEQIEVTVGDATYVIVEDLSEKELPEGFEAKDAVYGEYEWPIQLAVSEKSQYVLILLSGLESGEESWFFYDEESGAITGSKTITVAEALEYESLSKAPKEDGDNSLTIALGAAAAVFALAFAGLGGYEIYKKKTDGKPRYE